MSWPLGNTQRHKTDRDMQSTLGVNADVPGSYLMYNPASNRVTVSADVILDEWNKLVGPTATGKLPPTLQLTKHSAAPLVITLQNSTKSAMLTRSDAHEVSEVEPRSYEESLKYENWRDANAEELTALAKYDTFEEIHDPQRVLDIKSSGAQILKAHFIFKTKREKWQNTKPDWLLEVISRLTQPSPSPEDQWFRAR